MGVYDEIECYERSGQVKLWDCTLHTYRQFDTVPTYDGLDTYSIAMREGGFVNVIQGVLFSWTDEPGVEPIFDKYGSGYEPESSGELGDPYEFNTQHLKGSNT